MTPESQPTADPAPSTTDTAPNPPGATGISALARRISSRTTDLIAIAVVLIGGLSIGRQLIEWWRADPETGVPVVANESETNPWGSGAAPVLLEFGDAPLALSRQSVSGDREAALTQLVARCQAAVKGARQPTPLVHDAAESLVARTAALQPVAEEPGVWRVFRLDEHFPLVLGVRRFPEAENDRATPPWRLVCWGLAVPMGDANWTIYIFLASDAAEGATPEFALPPGSRRILGLRSDAGDALIAFSGRGNVEQWMAFFDREFEQRGLSAREGWQVAASVWSARFGSTQTRPGRQIEVGFSRDATGGLTGLIQVAP
ncbi:MAG: hypothetical protein EXS05_18765 [Planctomycetaceae bacterium]|nr:hypothetical protein [Planctomycetaceae bacterium]